MSEINVNSLQTNSNINIKSNDKKKFELLSKESIKLIAEEMSCEDMTEDAVLLLSSDVSYRLREVIDSAGRFMRHSKRRRLSTSDINRALEWSDCEQVLGFESNQSVIDNVFVKEANVWVCDEPVIDLNEEMNQIFDKNGCDLRVFENEFQMSVEWLSLNGSLPSNEDNCVNSVDLNEELDNYYKTVVNAILGTDNQLFVIALKDLSTNCQISPILPYLLNFLMNGIKKLSHDISQLKRFLHTIQCLFRNGSLFLATDPYLNVLIQSIVYCIVEPLNPKSDHWTLRDSASHLLVSVLKEWFCPFVGNRPMDQTLDSLRNCLLDFSKPFRCHYGAIKAFQALGFDIIVEHLYPILDQYFTHLSSAIDANQYSTDPEMRRDGLRVFGELLFIAELISLKMRSIIISNDFETKLDFNVYNQLSDIFGDSLYARLPNNFEKIRFGFYSEKNKNSTKSEIHLFETPESLQTGEELLDAFYEAPTHTEELRSEMSTNLEEDNSCDDNSFLSDNEKEATNVMIKSSVIDPTLGIKLTIKKLRRDENGSQIDNKRSRSTNRSISSEPIFDTIPLKQTAIRFNISGSTHENSILFDQPFKRPDYCRSEWFVLTMTNPKQYALRTQIRKMAKIERHLCLYSCDLLNVL